MTCDFTSSPRPRANDLPATPLLQSFVLLDDQTAAPGERSSRLYRGLRRQICIQGASELDAALGQMQAELERGRHVVMMLSYELGEELHGLPPRPAAPSQLLIFDGVDKLSAAEVDAWLLSQAGDDMHAAVTGVRSSVDEAAFCEAIERIRGHIAKGETYQVNYSFRLDLRLHGAPCALYRQLRAQQAVPFGALMALPGGQWVLSRSPELFVRHRSGWLEAQPMKGTAHAGQAVDLASDAKNRAENVMIVDLLRNDLGRIAENGSVSVPRQFEVHRFGDVMQMTSTVRAQLRPEVRWPELVRALFPCGSITGAPKRRTMELIRGLEPRPRGVYTGAIGWLEPAEPGCLPDFALSVPIRTLTLEPAEGGSHAGELGVGAGITWGSEPRDEWAECQLKARFLTRLATEVELFETLRASRQEGVAHLERHLARLAQSARALGFAMDEARIRQELHAACSALPKGVAHRIKLSLRADGRTGIQTGVLQPLAGPVQVLIAPEATQASDLFLRHKTTRRERYDEAWRAAEAQGAFDMLFFNQAGELTEGGRSNVFVKLGGHWYTPPLDCGVLPGVMRQVLLDDAALAARERRISRAELPGAEALMVCNALRGAMPAVLVP